MVEKEIDLIFRKPKHFGLRGDPGLWWWLKDFYENNPISDLSELENNIKMHLEEFGVDIDGIKEDSEVCKDEIFIKAFDKGGMSSGMISIKWWKTIGFPILKSRIDGILFYKSLYL